MVLQALALTVLAFLISGFFWGIIGLIIKFSDKHPLAGHWLFGSVMFVSIFFFFFFLEVVR